MKRNPWPYAIILYFVLFITAMTSWIIFAVRNDHQLVRKDYYEHELKFQNELDSLARASVVDAKIAYDSDKQLLKIDLPSDGVGSVLFYRPSDSRLDRTFSLNTKDGAQIFDLRDLAAGLWKVRVSWRTGQTDYRHDESIVIAPRRSDVANLQSSTFN